MLQPFVQAYAKEFASLVLVTIVGVLSIGIYAKGLYCLLNLFEGAIMWKTTFQLPLSKVLSYSLALLPFAITKLCTLISKLCSLLCLLKKVGDYCMKSV